MARPTVEELKEVLKLKTDADDGLIGRMARSAVAMIERYIGRIAWDDGPTPRQFGPTRAVYARITGLRITDDVANDNYTPTGTYDEFGRGESPTRPTNAIGAGPMSALPDFNDSWDPILYQAVTDLVVELYEHRNSRTSVESESGSTINYGRYVRGLPERVAINLDPILELSTT